MCEARIVFLTAHKDAARLMTELIGKHLHGTKYSPPLPWMRCVEANLTGSRITPSGETAEVTAVYRGE